MKNGQLEMSFGQANKCPRLDRRRRRQQRAQWWFDRMRHVVDHAIDWRPAPVARPQQTWIPGIHRQVGGVSGTGLSNAGLSRHVCE